MSEKPNKSPEQADPEAPEPAQKRPGIRTLPDNFEALATGEDEQLRRPRGPRTGLRDDRERVAITGVNNRDARLVYDARVAALQAAESDEARATGLFEAFLLGLWRARALTGFDAFAVDVVGLARDEARALAAAEAERAGLPLETLPEGQAALWLRTEAAVREHTPDGRVRLVRDGETRRLDLSVPAQDLHRAVAALAGVGRQAAGLGRHLEGRPPRDEGERTWEADPPRDGGAPPGRRPRQDGGFARDDSGHDSGHDSGPRGDDRRPRGWRDDRDNQRGGDRPRRDDQQRGGHGPRRDDDRRGGFGPRRDDQQRGGHGPRRDDQQRGGYGPRRDDQQRGGYGPRRDDQQRGGYGPRRDDQQRGGYGPRRDDDRRGGFGPRRDDQQRGGHGPRRDDDRRGDFGPRRDDQQRGGYGPRRDDQQRGGYGPKRDGGQGGRQGPGRDGGYRPGPKKRRDRS